jgi:myo-inositol-1(or 4)-monophosphatase
LNDRRLRVAVRRDLPDCIIGIGMPFLGKGDPGLFLGELAKIMPGVAGVRRYGAAALDLAWVAAGRFDGFWERGQYPWDTAAGILLIREAGGFVTDLDGAEATAETADLVAGNEAVHRQLLTLLQA